MDAEEFAGDLFLTLATQGRLELDAAVADEAVAGLRRTLDVVAERMRLLRVWEGGDGHAVCDLPPGLAQAVVDVVFAEQLTPGRLEQAARELPKYIEALRLARRPPP
ncbi:hypothetical protein [Micromonospora carbonacea]|uniref:Uncharacterized protein n=1 Tax=Micromonospora carbonacea TaxID=47853 RepID=A0A1C5ATZ0_9ACTN|nr:hypothetical protein [Micromonospora carbonacea]SCF48708.1 hypothetical protein GA0070563_11994 [Micromonospora carbonacea]